MGAGGVFPGGDSRGIRGASPALALLLGAMTSRGVDSHNGVEFTVFPTWRYWH